MKVNFSISADVEKKKKIWKINSKYCERAVSEQIL